MKFKIIQNKQTPKIESYKDLHTLLRDDYKMLCKFLSFARVQHNCAGLASNQVSLDGKRIMELFFAIFNNNMWDIIIHPTIDKYIGKSEEMEEGCLTWLGERFRVKRYYSIFVTYYNLKGEKIQRTINGSEAQIFQHEYDHLNGVIENTYPKK